LRRERPALAIGDYVGLPCDDQCLAYLRRHARQQLLVMLNFSERRRRVSLPAEVPRARLILSSDPNRALEPATDSIELAGVEGIVLEAA
jgi:alpha-glucosidase